MPIELDPEETRAWLTLLRAGGGVRDAVMQHGSAQAALARAPRATIAEVDQATVDGDLAWLDAPDHHLITYPSADYPSLLRNASSPPAALFVVGDAQCLWSPQIAIVGARKATSGGLANAHAFAKAFVEAGNVVTSGLAEGIDGAAHAAALDAGGSTIAVLGTGPDIVYPRRHRELAHRIAAHGALVSEFPPGTPGKPEHFPSRNRIIAGLSLGTLVIEAGLASGSLITARLAAEQGREVFALPGSIHHPLAHGCHRLIRDGAKLVETPEEVLEDLHGVGGLLAEGLRARIAAADAPARVAHAHDPDYARLLDALDTAPTALDELVARTGLSAAALSSMLLVLELDGAVFAENGRYSRR